MLELTLERIVKVNPNLSVEIKKRKLKLIKSKIESEFTKGQFSKSVDCSLTFLDNVLKGKMKPTLGLLSRICKKLGIEINGIALKIIPRSKGKSFIFIRDLPIKVSPELASLVGHSFGDGHIGISSFAFTNKSEKLREEVINLVRQLPIRNLSFNEWNHKAITIRFNSLVKSILLASGAIKGDKVAKCFSIPTWIKNGNKEIKVAFLKALFDDEASINVTSRQIHLTLHKIMKFEKNLEAFFKGLANMLNSLNIKGISILNEKERKTEKHGIVKVQRLFICGLINFKLFKENIGFIIPQKTEKLDRLIKKIKRNRTSPKEIPERLMKLLRKESTLGTPEIAKLSKISLSAALDNLKELEKRDIVKKDLIRNKDFEWSLK